MRQYCLVSAAFGLGVMLVVSGLDHAMRPRTLALALHDRGWGRIGRLAVPAVALVELLLGGAVLLAAGTGAIGRSPYVLASALFAGYAADLLALRRRSPAARCGCTGARGAVTGAVVARAVALSLLAMVLAAVQPPAAGLSPGDVAIAATTGAVFAVVVLYLVDLPGASSERGERLAWAGR